jgi:hypothetical protein
MIHFFSSVAVATIWLDSTESFIPIRDIFIEILDLEDACWKKRANVLSAGLHPILWSEERFCRPQKNCSFEANYLVWDGDQPIFYKVFFPQKYLQDMLVLDLRFLWATHEAKLVKLFTVSKVIRPLKKIIIWITKGLNFAG